MSDAAGRISEAQVWGVACPPSGSGGAQPLSYIATSDGLFSFDGSRLLRHPCEQVSTLRDVFFDTVSGRLYSAGFSGVGWWEADAVGKIDYHPLLQITSSSVNQDFWRVRISSGGSVFFQSPSRICIYAPEADSLRTIHPEVQFRFLHSVGGTIYVQDGQELCRISDDGSMARMCPVPDRIMSMASCAGKTVLALERTGLVELTGRALLRPLNEESNRRLSAAKIFSMSAYGDDSILVGTTRGGLFLLDSEGRIDDSFNYGREFENTTVLSVGADRNGDVWAGMEAGLARIDNSSLDYYIEDSRLGRVRGAVRIGPGKLLIGSNKGAFIYEDGRLSSIANTTGSVWAVALVGGRPYIAHDLGLFVLDDSRRAVPVYGGSGIISMAPCDDGSADCICGTYEGLALFRETGNGLRFVSRIKDYDGFCRDLHFDGIGGLWIRDRQRGFINLTLDPSKTSIVSRKDYDLVKSPSDRVFTTELDGKLLLCRNSEAFSVDAASGALVRSSDGTALLEACGGGVTGLAASGGVWWYSSPSGIGIVGRDGDGGFVKEGNVLAGAERWRNSTGPFPLGSGCAIGLYNSLALSFGPRSIKEELHISEVELLGAGSGTRLYPGARNVIPYDKNTLRIYIAGNPGAENVEYRLLPVSQEWRISPVREPILLSSLEYGNYQVSIRSTSSPDATCSLRFRVRRPWYISGWMIAVYLLLVAAIAIWVRSYYMRRGRKEREAVIKKMEEERLRSDLKQKGKELANITFNNDKRNNQLKEIKDKLTSARENGLSGDFPKLSMSAVALINSYLEDESDWEKSEEYFNIVYDGLLDRLRTAYPDISKTDLKICVYAKLNLSTKEIADVMNVSPRSVEMARYRLRKRLGLPDGQDIGEFVRKIVQDEA
ncbi:MAG: hypothetical protein IJ799_02935 [Bacteroidales bacterium]|nr:hypothetical protein [Bacteroidales bacterium]